MASVIVPDAELLAKITKTSFENLSKRLIMAGRLETDVNAMFMDKLIRAALVVFKTHGFVDSTPPPLYCSQKSCTQPPPPFSANLLVLMQFMRDEKEEREKQNFLEREEREKEAKRKKKKS